VYNFFTSLFLSYQMCNSLCYTCWRRSNNDWRGLSINWIKNLPTL